MNKAFVKGDEIHEDPEIRLDPRNGIPEGGRNYLTPQGGRRLRAELEQLTRDEWPRMLAAANESDPDSTTFREQHKALQRLERRIDFLTGRLALSEVIDPLEQKSEEVRFGATVVVQPGKGPERVYRIVGIDEADIERGCISWTSPLAVALLGARAGDTVKAHTPAGEEEIEIIEVGYLEIPFDAQG